MKNSFVLDFGDNFTSIFYWSDVEGSLEKLKESIWKRFTIHPDHQTIKQREQVLNEETFKELYESRFTNNYILNLQTTEHSTYSSQRREDICKQIPTFLVEIPDEFKLKNTINLKTKVDWTIEDYRYDIHKKGKLDGNFIVMRKIQGFSCQMTN